MEEKIEILLDENKIKEKVKELGEKITEEYKDKRPVFIGVLKGAFMFLADLVRNVKIEIDFDFVVVSLYKGEKEKSILVLEREVLTDLKDRDVLIVDEILDSGKTLSFLIEHIKGKGARSVKTCVLLRKKKDALIEPDFYGFEIPDKFVIGYGLDYKEKYRNLPFVAVLN
uniref:Hypoxanthine phosphoribosyltransferase n=1 Tax=candidate division WOR-3 bacterium TaxID=2052148 RepID=A0A7C4U795_UNCW3